MTRLDRCTAAERVEERRRYRFSGAGTENSLAVVPLFLATAYLAFALGCETRRVNPGPGVDGGAGGAAGAAAAGGSGTGSAGGAGGLPHVVSNDGGLDCATVGCGAPPLCSVGCHEACGCCACADGDHAGDLTCTGGCYAPSPVDASVDLSVDTHADGLGRDLSPDGAVCDSLSANYQAAVRVGQECTVGANDQCAVQVRAGFFCQCTTFVNTGADTLAAIAADYQASGCLTVCGGICAQVRALNCLADTTSPTGGRCQVPGVLTLQASNDGGTFSVAVGEEIDITLESIAPGSYSSELSLSSDVATVLEINIPAGSPNPNGPTRLYRVRAVSPGQVTIRIPFEPVASGPPKPAYVVTVAAR
jgi:hypothetical protein